MPLRISFRVIGADSCYQYHVTYPDLVESSFLKDPDLIVEYTAETLNSIAMGKMTFRQAHFAYQLRTIIRKHIPHQALVHTWA